MDFSVFQNHRIKFRRRSSSKKGFVIEKKTKRRERNKVCESSLFEWNQWEDEKNQLANVECIVFKILYSRPVCVMIWFARKSHRFIRKSSEKCTRFWVKKIWNFISKRHIVTECASRPIVCLCVCAEDIFYCECCCACQFSDRRLFESGKKNEINYSVSVCGGLCLLPNFCSFESLSTIKKTVEHIYIVARLCMWKNRFKTRVFLLLFVAKNDF